MYKKIGKRVLDLLLSILGLIILLPVWLSLLIIQLFDTKGRPFFFQLRPGKNEKIFKLIKFKTMKDFDPSSSVDIHSLDRTTKIGRFIRKYSLDEIPQLINVLKGDMSIVGPRPLLEKYLPLYNNDQKQRHLVKPGITGWAQVKGRNTISWEQKFQYDVWYVQNLSILLDLKIILLTVKKVFLKEGINSDENLNMPEFTGSKTN